MTDSLRKIALILLLTLFINFLTRFSVIFAQQPQSFGELKALYQQQLSESLIQVIELVSEAKKGTNLTIEQTQTLESLEKDYAALVADYKSIIDVAQSAVGLQASLQNYFLNEQNAVNAVALDIKKYEALLITFEDKTQTLEKYLESISELQKKAKNFGFDTGQGDLVLSSARDQISLAKVNQEIVFGKITLMKQATPSSQEITELNVEFARTLGYLRATRIDILRALAVLKSGYEQGYE